MTDRRSRSGPARGGDAASSALYQRKNDRRTSWLGPERPGNEGWYFGGLSLGKRVVIRHLRPAQRAGHAEVSEKLSGALARHWSSPIRVQGQDPGLDAMLQAALLDQPAGQGSSPGPPPSSPRRSL